MENELFFQEDLTTHTQSGVIITDDCYNVVNYSNNITSWFGGDVRKESRLPSCFLSSEPAYIIRIGYFQYICFNHGLLISDTRYHLMFLYPTKYLKSHLSQELIYNICYDEIRSTLDCVSDGVFITNEHGVVLMLNKTAEKAWSLSVDELIGKNIRELYKILYEKISDEEIEQRSVCLRTIKERSEVSMIQPGKYNQFKILATGTPYFRNGKILKVVSTERNLTELIELREQLEQNTKITCEYEAELEYYRSHYPQKENIIVKDKKMVSLFQLAYKVSSQNITVLLQGESGVGKDVFAKYIHSNSARRDKPFIDINCAAIPESLLESELFGYEKGAFTGANPSGKIGLFELADQGTLFLDEIGELPIHLQSKILRAVQERKILRIGGKTAIPIDVRIISATNCDLKEAVDKGVFREDLYYRLNVVSLSIPPLRERKLDLQALITYFLKVYNDRNNTDVRITSDAISLLHAYRWPGNIRELSNVIEASIATCDSNRITSKQLVNIFPEIIEIEPTFAFDNNLGLKEHVELYEKQFLLTNIPLFESAQSMADSLKIDKSTLLRKMNRYKIENTFSKRA